MIRISNNTMKMFRWVMLLFVTLVLGLRGAQAQQYLLGPDDIVSVIVMRHPEFSVDKQLVPSSGRIQVPNVGDVYVAGKTTNQVATEITARLKKELLRPEVTVVLAGQRSRRVFVLGAVATTGAYDVKPGFRVTEVLALAGGLSAAPERIDGTLSRAKRAPIKLNLSAIYADSDSPLNFELRNGDVLRFKERVVRINIVGQVAKTGALDVPVGSTVVQALALAGGTTPSAALTKVVLKHANGKQIQINLHNAIVRGEGEDKYIVQSGDLILVPTSQDRVTVTGAVNKPGFVDIPDGTTLNLAEALAAAGGPLPQAALTRAVLRRADGKELPLDLYQVSAEGSTAGNLLLKSGDSIVIPEAKGVTVLGSVAKPGTIYLEAAKSPRISDVIALAGGLTLPPEQVKLVVNRQTAAGKPYSLSIDTAALIQQNAWSQNTPIQDGDVIVASGAKLQTIFISGEVKSPGALALQENEGLTALITRAGGATPLASLRRVTITRRDGQVQMVDLLDAVKNGSANSFKLQEGDYVVVPENPNKVLVMAAVRTPGRYPIPEDRPLTVGEALALAGGPIENAKLKEIAILHKTPEGVQRRILSMKNAKDVQTNSDIALRADDILYVPQGQPSRSFWDVITRGIGTVATLGGAL